MVNLLWLGMILISIAVAGFNGQIELVTESIFNSAGRAVSLAFSLISIMSFWLGIMKLIEESGLIRVVQMLLRPVVCFLFPRVPREHPAMNAILMNMSANLLGMGSAATPFGIKAMEELQKLNPHPDTATDEMCTFLAVNTSSITLIPTTVIALRATAGSINPTEIVGTTVIATLCSTTVAIVFDLIFRLYYYGRGRM